MLRTFHRLTLASSCEPPVRQSSQQLRRLSARIFTLRGQSDPTAEADRLIEDSYSSMVEEYRRFPETEKKMRNFCKTDPTCS